MSLVTGWSGLWEKVQVAPLTQDRLALWLRLGLSVAILSVVFEKVLDIDGNLRWERYHLIAAAAGFPIAAVLVLSEQLFERKPISLRREIYAKVEIAWADKTRFAYRGEICGQAFQGDLAFKPSP